MDPLPPRLHRDVVSFVRRSTRMNESQMKAWERYEKAFVVDVPRGDMSTSIADDARVDWVAAFGREAPLIVEIGSGAGDSLAPMAEGRPDANVVAFEVFEPAVASTLGRLGRHGIGNVRVVVADGAQGLAKLFDDGSVSELWTFFADPWHKKRHHKRRLVGTDFADAVVAKLAPGGLWRLATDWEDYALWMREHLDGFAGLENVHGGWAPRLAERPVTKYERKGLEAGRVVFDLTYRRVDAPQD
ncbi:tRNA (guanosine(46)-N7)-methyltransferase TrmB [Tessaracoccus lacteus]|uniref:tRNA (guanine-N(7)-)-methyltransferase n=1 Tax=Tessaracoccus lacteus TaxID=3041766 RepID=A0ABY8PZR4_9ACTN|nr:tRNA (guanosine(46)-N7)-methyltransferase TrmB [Tessaracoccus sp. T21]WGT47945.1 tRNA (guanosine(46)-N7)-methyltransferase TrmB [Tessaracoccus sp. T21]